jgi:hypothetical protein
MARRLSRALHSRIEPLSPQERGAGEKSALHVAARGYTVSAHLFQFLHASVVGLLKFSDCREAGKYRRLLSW